MAARYWVGGNGNWDGTAGTKWATTSGGAGGAAVPTAADDVFLDNGTGTGNVTISAAAACRSLNCTGYTGVLTHNNSITLTIGDGTAGASNVALKLVSGMTYTRVGSQSSAITFASTSATQQTVDCAGKVMGNLSFGTAGSWILTGAVAGTGQNFTVTAGTVDTNGQTITCSQFTITGSTTRSVTLGASDITCYGSFNGAYTAATTTGLTFSGASSTITCNGSGDNEIFRGGGLTYGTVKLTGTGAKSITGANTFASFIRSNAAACGIKFPSNTTQTITGTFQCSGTAGNVVTITASTAGQAATLSKSSGTVSCDYMSVKDSTAAGGASWYAGANSTSVSGNSGWVFTAPGTTFTDAASGTLALTGTSAEATARSDSSSGTLSLTGTAIESFTVESSYSDSATGTLSLDGTATESNVREEIASGTIALLGAAAEQIVYHDPASGTVLLSGIVLPLTGTALEALTRSGACVGVLALAGIAAETLHVGPPLKDVAMTLSAGGAALSLASATELAIGLQGRGALELSAGGAEIETTTETNLEVTHD